MDWFWSCLWVLLPAIGKMISWDALVAARWHLSFNWRVGAKSSVIRSPTVCELSHSRSHRCVRHTPLLSIWFTAALWITKANRARCVHRMSTYSFEISPPRSPFSFLIVKNFLLCFMWYIRLDFLLSVLKNIFWGPPRMNWDNIVHHKIMMIYWLYFITCMQGVMKRSWGAWVASWQHNKTDPSVSRCTEKTSALQDKVSLRVFIWWFIAYQCHLHFLSI